MDTYSALETTMILIITITVQMSSIARNHSKISFGFKKLFVCKLDQKF